MHSRFLFHRDLKTSRYLKSSDFCRTEVRKPTSFLHKLSFDLVVPSPELLLSYEVYSSSIDMCSVGCIMGKLIMHEIML
jgi:hypothetical protein